MKSAQRTAVTQGGVFGEDMVLTDVRRRYHCTALTFVEAQCLSKESLEAILGDGSLPHTARAFRKYVISMACRTKLVASIMKAANQRKKGALEIESSTAIVEEKVLGMPIKSQIAPALAERSNADELQAVKTELQELKTMMAQLLQAKGESQVNGPEKA